MTIQKGLYILEEDKLAFEFHM